MRAWFRTFRLPLHGAMTRISSLLTAHRFPGGALRPQRRSLRDYWRSSTSTWWLQEPRQRPDWATSIQDYMSWPARRPVRFTISPPETTSFLVSQVHQTAQLASTATQPARVG